MTMTIARPKLTFDSLGLYTPPKEVSEKFKQGMEAPRVMYTVRQRDGREFQIFEDGTCSGFGEGAMVFNRIDLFINEAVNQARKADATRR